ncbi:hypothetical protein ACHAWF_007962, partial [Thalassiosira exigua]
STPRSLSPNRPRRRHPYDHQKSLSLRDDNRNPIHRYYTITSKGPRRRHTLCHALPRYSLEAALRLPSIPIHLPICSLPLFASALTSAVSPADAPVVFSAHPAPPIVSSLIHLSLYQHNL